MTQPVTWFQVLLALALSLIGTTVVGPSGLSDGIRSAGWVTVGLVILFTLVAVLAIVIAAAREP